VQAGGQADEGVEGRVQPAGASHAGSWPQRNTLRLQGQPVWQTEALSSAGSARATTTAAAAPTRAVLAAGHEDVRLVRERLQLLGAVGVVPEHLGCLVGTLHVDDPHLAIPGAGGHQMVAGAWGGGSRRRA